MRLLLDTHYQVNTPAIFSILISRCTSPNESFYGEIVAQRLMRAIKDTDIPLSRRAADFAVVMARNFGFLTGNNFWDWRGHVINILFAERKDTTPRKFTTLETAEKVSYLKYYLEADGAVILKLSQKLAETGTLSLNTLIKDPIIDGIFVDIGNSYLDMATDLEERMKIKEFISRAKYTEKVRLHKVHPHIEPLEDFGLIKRQETNKGVIYSSKTIEGVTPLKTLVDELVDIPKMETRFKNNEYFDIISKVLGLKKREYNPRKDAHLIMGEIVRAYQKARDEASGLATINTIIDVVLSRLLTTHGIVIKRGEFMDFLGALQKTHPVDVRFHVNRRGERAYLILSGEMSKQAI